MEPRRITAATVAIRVAEEVGCPLGDEVGYSIRFEDVTLPGKTKIKYMTDGMLIREILIDPLLSQYSVVMLDEAHERSIYTDILLGILKKIQKKRAELKIIVSSATLNAEEFLSYFNKDDNTTAKIISIEGKMYPVDILYLTKPTSNYIEKSIETIFEINSKIFGGTVLITLSVYYLKKENINSNSLKLDAPDMTVSPKIILRKEQIKKLKAHSQNDGTEYDLLIIGGGATGAGCALDAASRKLKVALVEKYDFSSGTSSKSTKLIHGGIRYLEKAVMKLDYDQYALVNEALRERATFFRIAPHLFRWWQIPYFWVGVKAYDYLAGKENLKSSYFLTKKKALDLFPMLKNNDLIGALVYHDGLQNDSRTNVNLILTSVLYGADVANYVEVFEFKKDENGKLCGAVVKDCLNGDVWTIAAKGIINATGPFTDILRSLDSPLSSEMMSLSSGVHIVLPGYYSPHNIGFIDPKTSDGRDHRSNLIYLYDL
ncbi:hypothetical protein PCK2_000366 [Pneumocystis canis]|nr:hypothetical protein PCK2_000366 [Pneumocystis canis]